MEAQQNAQHWEFVKLHISRDEVFKMMRMSSPGKWKVEKVY